MRTSHAKMKLRTSEFNALAEDLYIALGKAGVPYRQQNKLNEAPRAHATGHRPVIGANRDASADAVGYLVKSFSTAASMRTCFRGGVGIAAGRRLGRIGPRHLQICR